MNPDTEKKTVRVRIAVAVWPDGIWSTAMGGSDVDANDQTSALEEECEPGFTINYVVAEIPLPIAHTIQGEVVS